MKPGIYRNMPFDEYLAADGLNTSTLKTLAKCPALVQWEKDCPEDEDKLGVFDIGSALHCLILEPGEFDKRYAIEPKLDRRTKVGKALAAEFEDVSQGKVILTDKDYKMLSLMQGSVMAHPTARQLLENQTNTEVSIFSEDEDRQRMKIRVDLMSEIGGKTFLVDLKSIDKIDNVSKAINERGYAIQNSHYMETYRSWRGEYPDYFLFIFVAKTIECGRYPCLVGELSDLDKQDGDRKREALVHEYRLCRENNEWPGIMTFARYKWAK